MIRSKTVVLRLEQQRTDEHEGAGPNIWLVTNLFVINRNFYAITMPM